jgi:hypothetical protein
VARKNNNFLEQLQRRREQDASPGATTTEKSPQEMSSEELDEALTRARQDLLDAQHAELRERELARVQKPAGEEAGPRSLSDVLRDKQRDKRRTWR